MTTIWKRVEGYPYSVNSLGDVRRETGGSGNAKPGRILKPNRDRHGYLYVRLCREGEVRDFKVHRLVCAAFHGFANGRQVCHINGIRDDNRADNMRWGTAKDNALDRDRHGNTARGAASGRSVLSDKQAKEIRRSCDEARKDSQRVPRGFMSRLAEIYKINPHTLTGIAAGKGYNHG